MVGKGHYNLSGGAEEVQAVGQFKLWKGNVTSINNNSGHYKPSPAEAAQSVNALKKAGVDMSKAKVTTYDANGNVIH